MKSASAELIALINGSRQFLMADLYTFTLAGGTILRYTGADVAITSGGNTFSPATIERGTVREIVGVEVDSLEMQLYFGLNDLVLGLPWPHFARNGGLDGARLLLEKAFLSDWLAAPAGALTRFTGRVSDVTPGRTGIALTVKSDLELLNISMPRNLYQSSCLHALYDAGCALAKAAFGANSSVSAGSDARQVLCGLAQAAGYFDQGTITCTSGANNGITRTVKRYTPGVLTLSVPLPGAPGVGDTFTAYPGCDKSQMTCTATFGNKANFKGFPYVPVPESAL